MGSTDPTVPDGARTGTPKVTPAATEPTIDASHPGARLPAVRDLQVRPYERYRRMGEIARGGMGRIIAAHDVELGRVVAIKELLVTGASLERRFEREVRITARLQHPGIIAVQEAGRWPDGAAFYTMPHVVGRPLDAVVAEAKTLDERLPLVARVLAIADALAYAHGEQVIHRDLKPSNVLVGKFGETIVIDWGLAKHLGDAEDSLTGASSGDGEMTTLGDAIGTPSYMPPEQARGERVDARADVYALGGILYNVLSGVRPYAELRSGADIVSRVLAEPPTPLDTLVPDAPADLRAIVAKAMARAPADRYATAAGFADDLRRFTSGQLVGAHRYSLRQILGRWVRRHRAIVAVASLATVAVTVVGALAVVEIRRERDEATAQRGRAEARRAEVEELLDFMLGDLQAKLQPVGKLDLLELVADKAVDYYARQPFDPDDDAAAHRRGVAHTHVGDVRAATGDLTAAIAAYRVAVELFAHAGPRSERDLARGHELIGRALQIQGDVAGALAEQRQALALREQVLARGADPEVESQLASSYNRIGLLLAAQGDLPGALISQQAGLAIAERLAAAAPDDLDAQMNVAVMHVGIGDVLEAQLDPPGSLAAYRKAIAITERVARLRPEDTKAQQRYSIALDRAGTILLQLKDLAGALEMHRAGLVIARRLAALDPSNVQWQRDVSISHVSIGDVLLEQGELAAALAEFEAAYALRVRLAEIDPSNGDAPRDVATSLERIGTTLLELGRTADALARFRASFELRAHRAAAAPGDPLAQRDLYIAHFKFGNVNETIGEPEAARASYREAIAIAERAQATFTDVPWFAEDLVELREALAKCCKPVKP